MPVYTEADLENKIKAVLGESCSHVKATDESDGCGSKFEIVIVSRCALQRLMLSPFDLIRLN